MAIVQNSIDVRHTNDGAVEATKRPMTAIAGNYLSLNFVVLDKACLIHTGSGIHGNCTKSTGIAVSVLACLIFFQTACNTTFVDDSGRVENSISSNAITVDNTHVEPQLRFEKNLGQTDPSVAYLARGSGYTVFVRDDETVFALRTQSSQRLTPGEISTHSQTKTQPMSVLRMRFEGANSNRQPAGNKRLGATSHYLIGSDPSRWQTHVPHYERVLIEELYAGIDLVYYGSGPRLEYDFIVSPRADPTRIAMVLDGASKLGITNNGSLLVTLADTEVTFKPPIAYQTVDGHQQPVSVQYVMTSDNSVAFELSPYEEDLALVIDPVLIFSSFLGGSGSDLANAIAVDGQGNIYLTGNTQSADFPQSNALQEDIGGGFGGTSNDAFITKLDPTGTNIIYSTFLGGSETEEGFAISVDDVGNVYVTGGTDSFDFPTTNDAFQPATMNVRGDRFSDVDAFVVKLSATGDTLLYSTYLSGGIPDDNSLFGSGIDVGRDIAVDSIGRAYVTGSTASADFPTTGNALQGDFSGGSCLRPGIGETASDGFVTVFDPTGSSLVYSTYLGGNQFDSVNSVAIDSEGNAYVAGLAQSVDLPTTTGVLQPNLGNIQTIRCSFGDAFVAKIDPFSGTLLYATYLGGTSFDSAEGVVVDSAGNAIVTGSTDSNDFPVTVNAIQGNNAGQADIFLAKLTPDGAILEYATFYGGASSDSASAIAMDSEGDFYITGTTDSTDFPVTDNALQDQLQGGFDEFGASTDAFVTKLALDGSGPSYSTFIGGSGVNPFNVGDQGTDIAVDGDEVAYISGFTNSIDLPTTPKVFQPEFAGGIDVGGRDGDGFVAKIAEVGQIVASVLPSSRSVQVGIPATFFVTILNSGSTTASECSFTPLTNLPVEFQFRTTDPATNEVTGTLNTPVAIPSGGEQSFVGTLMPTAPVAQTEVQFSFDCINTAQAASTTGLNTLTLTASATPVSDIVSLAATLQGDGIVHLNSTGAFAVATVNVGAPEVITVTANTGGASLPLSITLCETDPSTGACLADPSSSVTTTIEANATPTFGIFVDSTDTVPFDPATNRVFVQFKDASGVTRGSTSVAVQTTP